MLEFRELGPLMALIDGAEARFLERRSKTVLGILIVRRGEAVSTDDFVDLIWGGDPPDSALGCVYNYVREIRGQLVPPGAVDPIETLRDKKGYRFHPELARFAETRFAETADSADEAADRGDLEVAWKGYDDAFSLWRGNTPMSDIWLPATIRKELGGLTERRLTVREEWCGVGLRLGRPRKVAPALRELSPEKPLSESVHSKLMVAEARSGHPDRVRDIFEEFRKRTRRRYDREPSARMRRLYERIEADDPVEDLFPVA